jgi:hypothetical protein
LFLPLGPRFSKNLLWLYGGIVMSRSSPSCLSEETLPEPINHRLKVYCVTAAAAGVGLLALAQPAEGKVIVTKKTIQLPFGANVLLDLNNDGKADFQFQVILGAYDHSFYASMFVTPLTGGEAVGGKRGLVGPYASALAQGANIGPSDHFSTSVAKGQITIERSGGTASAGTYKRDYGPWNGVGNRYLGVKFLINGATHYGWIRLTVNTTTRVSGTITEYAYETVAGKTLTAGSSTGDTDVTTGAQSGYAVSKPGGPSLGMLALGDRGLEIWRRE